MTTICEQCNNENHKTDFFCTQCGSQLPGKESRAVAKLSERIKLLERELDSIKQIQAGLSETDAVWPGNSTRSTGLQSDPDHPPVAGSAAGTAERTTGETAESSQNRPQDRLAINPLTDRLKLNRLENLFGGNWLARVGALAFFMGITFLVKLAFDEGLGSELILAGVIFGAGFLVFGELFWSRYPVYAHALSGGGVAILYSCLLAASASGLNETPVINPWLTIGLLLIVSMISVRLALIKNSQPLALLGVAGALSAPFLYAGISGSDNGLTIEEQRYFLIGYVLTIDIGVLVVAVFRDWTWFKLVSVFGSYAGFMLWLALANFFDSDDPHIHITLPILSLLFLMMLVSVSGFHLIRRRTPGAFNYSPMVWNALLFALISYVLLNADEHSAHSWRGIPTLVIGLLHLGIAYPALARNRVSPTLALMLGGIGIICVTIFIPMQFSGYPLIIGMSGNAFFMTWLSIRTKSNELRLLALASFAFVILRLLWIGTGDNDEGFQAVLNTRFMTFIWTILILYSSAFVYQKYRSSFAGTLFEIPKWVAIKENLDRNARWLYRSGTHEPTVIFFIVSANILSLWLLTTEVVAFVDYQLNLKDDHEGQAKLLSITVLWAVYAAVVIITGIILKAPFVRLAGLGMLTVTVIKLFLIDTFQLDQLYRVSAYIVLGAVLLSGGFLYQRYQNRVRDFITQPSERWQASASECKYED